MLDALFFGRHDVAGHNRQNRAVHGHGNRHLVQGNLIEKDFHILNRIDGNTGLADIAHYPGMIRVIPPVGCKIKGHRKSGLTGRHDFSVKFIGLFGRGKTGILTDGPGPSRIHGGHGTPNIRCKPRQGIHVLHALKVFCGVQRFYQYAFIRLPVERLKRFSSQLFGGQLCPFLYIRIFRHGILLLG